MDYNGISVENLKNYYDVVYDSTFPVGNYFVDRFETFPSSYSFSEQKFKPSVIKTIAGLPDFTLLYKRSKDDSEHDSYIYENEKSKVLITINQTENKDAYHVAIYHAIETDIEDLTREINQHKNRIIIRGITLIKTAQYGLETVDFEVKSSITANSLELGYGKEFQKVHDLIVKELNTPKSKGLVLLHGACGTGKSYYLKYLSTLMTKKVLWLPQTSADSLCSPDFITFLMDNIDSILIIEDGERVIKSRESSGDGSDTAVSNLLNLTDGILSDCLHIQVVATFNTDIKNIDKALLRKGRLIVDYEFGNLSVENTNRLLKHLGINHVSEKEMCLADIYNFEMVDLSNKKQHKKIGF